MDLNRLIAETLEVLSPLQRDLLRSLISVDEGASDEAIARRHDTTPQAVKRNRILARLQLQQRLAISQ